MLGFLVKVNGAHFSLAAAEDLCSLAMTVDLREDSGAARADTTGTGPQPRRIVLSIAGGTERKAGGNEYLYWGKNHPLSVGDEVTVEIVETLNPVAPTSREPKGNI